MLPLNRNRYPQTQGRYPQPAPTICFYLLNGGLTVRLVAEPLQQLTSLWPVLLAAIVDFAGTERGGGRPRGS